MTSTRKTKQWWRAAALVLLAAAGVPAAPEDVHPAIAAIRLISVSLARIESAATELTEAQLAALKACARETRADLVALRRQIGRGEVSEAYLDDLAAAGLVLRRMLAKSVLEAEDLARLQVVARDLAAKRRWAEARPDAPTGEAPLEFALATGAGTRRVEAVFRNAIDDVCEFQPPVTVGARPVKAALRPGHYALWVRTPGTHPALHGRARLEFTVDGTTTRIEVAPP